MWVQDEQIVVQSGLKIQRFQATSRMQRLESKLNEFERELQRKRSLDNQQDLQNALNVIHRVLRKKQQPTQQIGYAEMYLKQLEAEGYCIDPEPQHYGSAKLVEEDLCSPITLPSLKQRKPLASARQGPVGKVVVLHNGLSGIVRFAGPTQFASGHWFGIELFEPQGKHNGTFRGVQYFKCSKKDLPYGLFVRKTQIRHWE